jgi:hypothetical protein
MSDNADQFLTYIRSLTGAHGEKPRTTNPANFTEIAQRNRISLALADRGNPDDNSSATTRALRAALHLQNAAVLSLVAVVARALKGMDFIVFKGPVQQKVIYGTFFQKPSGDVDVLVPSSSFEEARERLTQIGLSLPHECTRIWWRHMLGEQHLVQENPHRPSVDLHHRLQRPGCPSPTSIAWFYKQKQYIDVGGLKVPVPTRAAIALICSLNLIKALYGGETGGGHALDLWTLLRSMTSQEKNDLLVVARRQGLAKTLNVASHISNYVFGSENPSTQVTKNFEVLALARALVDPEENPFPTKRGPAFLREFSDGNAKFAKDAAWYYVAEIGRVLE